jgi:hypothetical protein
MTIAAWELVLEAARSLTGPGSVEFTRSQLLDEVRRRDASRRPESGTNHRSHAEQNSMIRHYIACATATPTTPSSVA